jgi:glutathione S-transferase
VTRLDTYSIALDATTRAYADAILILPAFQEWRSAAMEEEWIVEADEVDEEAIEDYRKAA